MRDIRTDVHPAGVVKTWLNTDSTVLDARSVVARMSDVYSIS
jgi:hypothetical protein